MAAAVPGTGEPTVVELGPGTGAITAAIQRRLDGRGTHLAIERNPQWAALVQERFPGVRVVRGDVADLAGILADRDGPADAVVSGLPWAAYRGRFVAELTEVLARRRATGRRTAWRAPRTTTPAAAGCPSTGRREVPDRHRPRPVRSGVRFTSAPPAVRFHRRARVGIGR